MFKFIVNWFRKSRVKTQDMNAEKNNAALPVINPSSIHLHWHVSDISQFSENLIWNAGQLVSANLSPAVKLETSIFQDSLLDNAKIQWQFGDWKSLARLEYSIIEQHPDRMKLALLAAAGHSQLGDMRAARDFVQFAREWGCDNLLISQVLVAGVYNTLGKVALIQNNTVTSKNHFRAALDGIGNAKALEIFAQAREEEETKRIQEITKISSTKANTSTNTRNYVSLIPDEIFSKDRIIALNTDNAQLLLTNTTEWQTVSVLAGAHYCIEGKIIANLLSDTHALAQIEFLDEYDNIIFFKSSGLSESVIGYYQYIAVKKTKGYRFFIKFHTPKNCFIVRFGLRACGNHSIDMSIESPLDLTFNTNYWTVAYETNSYQTAVTHYKEAYQLLDKNQLIDAIKLFVQAEKLAPQLVFPYHLMHKLAVYNPNNLSCLNEKQQYSNTWAITEQLFITILSILPVGSTILELGSGTGTQELTRYYQVISIEHNPDWLNKSSAHYIHAPLIDDYWYDPDVVAEALKQLSYDLLLIDGPPQHRRAGIIDHFDLFTHDVPIIFDDIVRDEDTYAMNKIAKQLGKTPRVYLHGKKGFAVI